MAMISMKPKETPQTSWAKQHACLKNSQSIPGNPHPSLIRAPEVKDKGQYFRRGCSRDAIPSATLWPTWLCSTTIHEVQMICRNIANNASNSGNFCETSEDWLWGTCTERWSTGSNYQSKGVCNPLGLQLKHLRSITCQSQLHKSLSCTL